MTAYQFIFDATDGNLDARCIMRAAPNDNAAQISGIPAAVGVISDQHGDVPIESLRLLESGVGFRVATGYSRADIAHVNRLRSEIDSAMLDAGLTLLVEIARELLTTGVDPVTFKISLPPRAVRVATKLNQVLSFFDEIDEDRLDSARDALAEYRRILNERT